jgi:subtilase family serine protease
MGGTRSVSALAPSAASTGSTKVKIPTVATGDYFVLACADDTDVVVEGDEANNCIASATTIHVTVPDLVVTALDNPPAAAVAGSSFTENATTGNLGNGSSRASTTRFYVSLDKRKNAGDVLLTGTDPVGALAPAASEAAGTNLTIPSGTAAGRYYLLACADDLKAVKESNEKNNCTASIAKVAVT